MKLRSLRIQIMFMDVAMMPKSANVRDQHMLSMPQASESFMCRSYNLFASQCPPAKQFHLI